MPKVLRGYDRQDFSELFNDLNNTKKDVKTENNVKHNDNENCVDVAWRNRSSLIDNSKMLYAYSSKEKVLHDRDCECVSKIPDLQFCMTNIFIKHMKLCPCCCRKLLIRYGLGDDQKRIGAYEKFFDKIGATEQDLYILLIANKAKLKWVNKDTMNIRFCNDTWRVIRGPEGLELWHNNYIRLEDNTRFFIRDSFHKQVEYSFIYFGALLKRIFDYSWESHVDINEDEKKSSVQ